MIITLYVNHHVLDDLDRGAAASARLIKYPELDEDVAVLINTKKWKVRFVPVCTKENPTKWESAIIYKY